MSASAYAARSRSRSRNSRASSADACASILISGSVGAAVIGPPSKGPSGPPPVAEWTPSVPGRRPQYEMSVTISKPLSFSRPLSALSSMRNARATISPLSCFTSSIVSATVPPVARRSSTMRTREPGLRASLCISRVADPYSRSYSTLTTSEGSLPSLRTGTKPTPSLYAIGAAKMNPRDSIPTTASIFFSPILARRPSMAALNASPSFRRVVMSLKRIPGFGKSGTSRIRLARLSTCTGTTQRLIERRVQVALTVAQHLARRALSAALLLALIVPLAGCDVRVPSPFGAASLPKEFPSDFPTPPSSKLQSATGPLPFVPAELRGITAQWTSTLTRAELVSFYAKDHAAWRLTGAPLTPPTAGPVTLGTIFVMRHDGDGLTATVGVGMSNMIDNGTLVQATILPARPSPSPP